MNGSCKIALELTARDNTVGVARPIELELVDAIVAHELHAGIAECRVVFRPGERKTVVHDFVSRSPSRRYALLFRFTVAAPGRHPDARSSSIARGRFAQFCEPVGKSSVKLPQRRRIVPAIVEEKQVNGDAPLLC